MLSKRTSLFLAILLAIGTYSVKAQVDQTINYQNKIADYLEDYPEENLFLHISKPHFLTGEILWFRIYHYSSLDHTPLVLSKVVYIELLDGNNESILQTKVKIDADGGAGSIYLPTTMNSGNYKLIAYTQWMRNFDESFYFSSEVQIINPFKRLNLLSENRDSKIDLQFFPEGGKMVGGIHSRVAFKAINKYGKGVFIKGVIMKEGRDTVARFASNRLGIGSFEMIPETNTRYLALVTDSSLAVLDYPFPEVLTSGHTMRLEREGNTYSITVEGTGGTSEGGAERLYLSGLSRNRFIYFESKIFNGNTTIFNIPSDSLNEGINQFTLFNNRGIPLCERKVFHYPQNKLNIEAKINNTNPEHRTSVEINFETKDQYGSAVTSDLSLSIYSTDSSLNEGSVKFETYMWLLSELKGQVENPDYYFSNSSNPPLKDMDDLMLSQGWSRYNIGDILDDEKKEIQYIPEFIDQVLTASLISKSTGQPVSNQEVTLSFINNYAQLFADRSDDKGQLFFETWNVFGAKDIIIGYPPGEESPDLEISVDPQFSGLVNRTDNSLFVISPKQEKFLIEQSVNMQVGNIFESGVETVSVPDTSSFYGIPDASYLLDNYTRFPVMEEVMREYVYGVNVRRENGKFVFKVLDIPRNEIMTNNPLVLLDGLPVYDIDKIMRIDPLNIRKIDVVHSKYYYGPLECNGIVAFYSYNSDLPDLNLDKNSIRQSFLGFQEQKSFYTPKYDTQEAEASRLPDFRNQLLWEPQIQTDENGFATLNFYTSDKSGTYQIVIHGLSSNGLAGSYFGTINVVSE